MAAAGRLGIVRVTLNAPRATDPLLLLAHGAGFNAGVWRPTVERLRRSGLRAELLAFDWAGHGQSAPNPAPWAAGAGTGASAEAYDWREVAPRDVFELLAQQPAATARRPLYGIGHSFGGAGLVLAELARPGTFDGLVLIEPIIRAPGPDDAHPLVERALRRRSRFDAASRADVAAHFARRAYAAWDADALAGYVERGFRAVEGGGFELACAPETEASVYLGGMRSGAFERLPELGCGCAVAAGGKSETLGARGAGNIEQHRRIAAALRGCTLPVAVAQGRGHSVPSARTSGTCARPASDSDLQAAHAPRPPPPARGSGGPRVDCAAGRPRPAALCVANGARRRRSRPGRRRAARLGAAVTRAVSRRRELQVSLVK